MKSKTLYRKIKEPNIFTTFDPQCPVYNHKSLDIQRNKKKVNHQGKTTFN